MTKKKQNSLLHISWLEHLHKFFYTLNYRDAFSYFEVKIIILLIIKKPTILLCGLFISILSLKWNESEGSILLKLNHSIPYLLRSRWE